MKSAQFFKYTTWGMLLLNLGMLGLFFFNQPAPTNGFRALDKLNLNEEQHELFLVSAKKHNTIIEEVAAQQKTLLRPYFQQLVNQDLKIDDDDFLSRMQALESQKITATYQHFLEIRNILKKDQLADFEEFMNGMLAVFLVENKKNPRPPKGF